MYFKEPYSMYYEHLVGEKAMTTSASKLVASSENAFLIISRFLSIVEGARWRELGYYGLVSDLIPSIKDEMNLLKNNISNGLSIAVDTSINILLPILENIKNKDGELNEINAQLAALVEPKAEGNDNDNDSALSHYFAEKSRLSAMAEKLTKEIEELIEKADIQIDKIKALNGNVQGSGKTTGTDVPADVEQLYNQISMYGENSKIANIEYVKTNDRYKSGNYFIVTFDNGKKLYLHQQKDGTGGMWNKIDIGKSELWNGGGGCSVFATSAAFSWLLGEYIPPREVMIAGGGQFGGIREIATKHSPITINGQKYIIDAEVSSINKPYGSGTNKTEVVNDWYNTLKSGGVVVVAVGGVNQSIREYTGDGDNTRVVYTAEELRQQTGITSKQGHVIAMVGLDENGKIIFADSMYDVNTDGNGAQIDSRAYDKDLTLDEFYSLYGGKYNYTHIDSSNKTYVTIKNATIRRA